MKKLAALIALAGLTTAATAQPGTRNAIVYGARALGETTWHFGSFTLFGQPGSEPLTFEVGVFFERAQGVGHATAVYKTYMDGLSTANGDSAQIIEDPSNGVPATGIDGRVSVYNSGAQVQGVFTNRHASAPPGPGFRISSAADTGDTVSGGGISVKQAGPPNFNFHTASGELGFRFNITVARAGNPRDILVSTPVNKINSYSSFNSLDSNTSSEYKATTTSDPIMLRASWIPAPSTLALLGLGGLVAGRRRRASQSAGSAT